LKRKLEILKRDLLSRSEQIGKNGPKTTRNLKNNKIGLKHGCEECFQGETKPSCCLFKPNWNDNDLENEKYFLNILIVENVTITRQILDTFMKKDVLKSKTFIYLDHLEPCENLFPSQNDDDKKHFKNSNYERPLTPLETCYIHRKLDLVTHPVITALITAKYNDFGRLPYWIDTFKNICLLVVWTVFAIIENYSIRHYYSGSNRVGKIILLTVTILFFGWDMITEAFQIYYSYRRIAGYRKYIRVKEKHQKESQRQENMRKSGRNTNRSETSAQLGTGSKNQPIKMDKYSSIEKEAKIAETIPNIYNNNDNWFDWITIVSQFVSLLTHFIDMGDHNDRRARVHIIFVYFTVILVWLRQLLAVNGFAPGINLVCMLRLMGTYIIDFGILYVRIFIPFLLLFWAMYVGSQIPQSVMTQNWRECESLKYNLPYPNGNFNRSDFEELCESSGKSSSFFHSFIQIKIKFFIIF
jgi:hypothetical protein